MRFQTHGKGTNVFITDAYYWDCECEFDYIHHISDVENCIECGADPNDQPNSRVLEIVKAFDQFERAEHESLLQKEEEYEAITDD